MAVETQEEGMDTENWYRDVNLVHTDIREERLPENSPYRQLYLSPKGTDTSGGVVLRRHKYM